MLSGSKGVIDVTRAEALKLVAILEAAYPRQELREETAAIYAQFLQDLDYQIASKVVQNHIRNERWFPTIAELREACVEMVHVIPTPETAMELIRMASQTASYQLIKGNELLMQAVASVGGIERLGRSENPEPLYRQAREAYENLRKREIRRLKSTPAVGMLGPGEQRKSLEGRWEGDTDEEEAF